MSMKVSIHVQRNAVPSEAVQSQYANWVEIYPEGDDNATLTLFMPHGVPFEKVQAVSRAINTAIASVLVKEDAI